MSQIDTGGINTGASNALCGDTFYRNAGIEQGILAYSQFELHIIS